MAIFERKAKKDKSESSDRARVSSARPAPAGILRAAHITEKAAGLGENRFVFLVAKTANKTVVKQAVEAKFGVHVTMVRTITLPAKMRRRGAQTGWKPGLKKAIVVLRKGERIETK